MMNPFPGPQSVLVMDNAAFHHNGRIQEIVEEKGCHLIYLPLYSPDLNPIEKGFSVLKANIQ
jgi:transposase